MGPDGLGYQLLKAVGSLAGTKNTSVVGPDRLGYQLLKAVLGTRLGGEGLIVVVMALRSGHIHDQWRDMRVVLILQLDKDLTLTSNWRLLNLIHCIGKLEEKVVVDQVQEHGEAILHFQQYVSVCKH